MIRAEGRTANMSLVMERLLVLLMLLWSSESDDIRLVEGDGPCAGTMEIKQQEWILANVEDWTLWDASAFYSVRLLNGSSLCSGILEVRSNQSNQQWSSVCEADFDQQDAEVVCRELGCGTPVFFQGALFGEVEAPMWTKEFQCAGDESGLLDCKSSDSVGNTCSPGRAVGLICSESGDIRLVGGDNRCEGTLEMKLEEWRPVNVKDGTLKTADVFCQLLDCGSVVSVGQTMKTSDKPVWRIMSHCVEVQSPLRECMIPGSSSSVFNLICSARAAFQHQIPSSSSESDEVEGLLQGHCS
uniref:SRCR domain-containing protein n=1 Tax=Stegastes partitus TaxID=144197 RepID=A0A3B5B5A2_9TELE